MTHPDPFTYPAVPHVRRHGPRGYQDPADYKPWLRDEFAFRCAYCLEREMWYPDRADSFSVDHFFPQSVAPGRVGDYDNLVYSCTRCNSVRRADPAPLDPARSGYAGHMALGSDGRLTGLTHEGRLHIRLFRLNEPPALDTRRDILLLLEIEREQPGNPLTHALFLARFGYPADLPDLARLRPPGGNNRPEGVAASYHARRARGDLPDVY